MKKNNWLKSLSCSVFAGLYLIVAVISLICSTEFFKLAHSGVMSWVLAIGFEIGAMSCLLSTLILPKKKLGLVWFMFVVLTLFQCMGNMYAAFINLENFQDWIDMFGMSDMELIAQKRALAGISGVILPLVALGFIRIMADVLQDGHDIEINDSSVTVQNENPDNKEEKPAETREIAADPEKTEETEIRDNESAPDKKPDPETISAENEQPALPENEPAAKTESPGKKEPEKNRKHDNARETMRKFNPNIKGTNQEIG